MQLKDTLNLPRTAFPMRASLTTREPPRLAHWEKSALYARLQEKNAAGSPFILHDGPPFTNGDVHIGTALNKLLKDLVLRYKAMRGFRTPYVPGWDCHGLPIEAKVTAELRAAGKDLSAAELRAECAKFSAGFIEKQRAQFQRLGVLADWAHEYKTMAPAYEAAELRAFAQFVERGLVYRFKKPVLWTIPYATALAEAEIEYKDHTSPAIYVKFPVPAAEAEKFHLPTDKPLSIVIWTTTPWTLPANLAIAVHPEVEYVVLPWIREGAAQETFPGMSKYGGTTEYLLVARPLVEAFAAASNIKFDGQVRPVGLGKTLEHLHARHPFIDRPSPVLLAEYVTMDTGTGCVHTAPGHGHEDWQTGLKYLKYLAEVFGSASFDDIIYCPVDERGRYLKDGKVPAELTKDEVTVFEKRPGHCPANDAVIQLLKKHDALVGDPKEYQHQYPFCWRSKTPVIFRATYQWFIGMDHKFSDGNNREQLSLREMAVKAIQSVQWIPSFGVNRIGGAVVSRPDWCISRQRSWGVPIPVFYDDGKGNVYRDAKVILAIADKIEKQGSNIWFEQSAQELLKDIEIPEGWPELAKLSRSFETLDVWIDSGCSHAAVLQRDPRLHWPADLYLEGSDQHRGWFQSSLWTALATKGAPPYKAVLTHGFVVDESGRKLSKSDGKPQNADVYVNKFGADLIRLWVASENFQTDITFSDKILDHVGNLYRGLRNTLMYLLGNLADFAPARDAVAPAHFSTLEKWVLHRLHGLVTEVTAAFDAYDFHLGVKAIDQFVSVTLSRQYHDILKDRLYTFAPAAAERRAAQTVMHHVLGALLRLLAPVLPFTADEAYAHLVAGADFAPEDDSIHLQSWPVPDDSWASPDFAAAAADVEAALKFRERVYEKLEALRQEKKIGKFLDAAVTIAGPAGAPLMMLLNRHLRDLSEWFIVSQVRLEAVGDGEDDAALTLTVVPAADAGLLRCPRSWRWVPEIVPVEIAGLAEKVSPRDRAALLAKYASA